MDILFNNIPIFSFGIPFGWKVKDSWQNVAVLFLYYRWNGHIYRIIMFGIPFGWKVKDSWQNFAVLFLYYAVKWTFYWITFRYFRLEFPLAEKSKIPDKTSQCCSYITWWITFWYFCLKPPLAEKSMIPDKTSQCCSYIMWWNGNFIG